MRSFRTILVATASVLALGCGGVDAAGDAAGSRSGNVPNAMDGPLVDRAFESAVLEAYLPQTFAGLERVAVRGNSQEWEGAVSTGVEGEYGIADAGFLPPVTITIWDHGASEYYLRTYGMLRYETEEVSGDEVTRHTTFRGHATGESQSRMNERLDAGMEIFVAGRILVDIQTFGIPLDELRTAAASLDLEGLAALAGS